jgi:hypothetical protein
MEQPDSRPKREFNRRGQRWVNLKPAGSDTPGPYASETTAKTVESLISTDDILLNLPL